MANEHGADTAARKLPSLEELRRAYEEGIPQTLLSGIEVKLRPIQPEMLLELPEVPDMLTELVMGMFFPVKEVEENPFPDEEDDVQRFVTKPRDEKQEALEYIRSLNIVCDAVLVDASVRRYLSLNDRVWIFKLAWLPVDVLSTFRLQPESDVEAVSDEQGQSQQAEQPVSAG